MTSPFLALLAAKRKALDHRTRQDAIEKKRAKVLKALQAGPATTRAPAEKLNMAPDRTRHRAHEVGGVSISWGGDGRI